jgi:threonine synthase
MCAKKTASNEIEIVRAQRIGLYVEPTSAIPAAAFTKLLDRRVVQPSETTVLVLTGGRPEDHRRTHRGPADAVKAAAFPAFGSTLGGAD